AGGGFPQWNCACRNCRGVREGTIDARPRLQESVAVGADDDAWILLNASPDVRLQIERFRPLHPRRTRHTPIAAIVLTSGELDHCLGLFSLREAQPLVVYATERVWRELTERNALSRTLARVTGQIAWCRLELGRERAIEGTDLRIEAQPSPGKVPAHLEGL